MRRTLLCWSSSKRFHRNAVAVIANPLINSMTKIMSLICHRALNGRAWHATARTSTELNDYMNVVTSGGTGQHQI